ncbi:hypothetical protein ACE6H2_001398 [Prunus campanulata]
MGCCVCENTILGQQFPLLISIFLEDECVKGPKKEKHSLIISITNYLYWFVMNLFLSQTCYKFGLWQP